jgi:biotin carboxyl carrier protein
MLAGIGVVSFVALCFLAVDLFAPASAPGAVVDAGSAVAIADAGVTVVDAGSAVAVVDAGSAVAIADAGVAVVDAGSAGVIVDAGSTAAGAVTAVDAGDAGDAGAGIEVVRARVAGRATRALVAAGQRVDVGSELVVVEVESVNLRRKLATLKGEEAEFAQAVRTVPSARADLEAIRAEIRGLEARLKPVTVKSERAGVVVEVLVRDGDVVRDAAPLLRLRP